MGDYNRINNTTPIGSEKSFIKSPINMPPYNNIKITNMTVKSRKAKDSVLLRNVKYEFYYMIWS